MSDETYIVIYDTYCGWCYGAAPVFDALAASGAKVEALHRHLFQGPLAYRLSEGKGTQILAADARIHELTGQEFSETYKQNVVLSDNEVLNSQYTAQAAELVRDKGVEAEFSLRRRLEKARFVDGISAADRDAVVAALIAEGVPEAEAERVGTKDLAEKAAQTSRRAQDLMAQVGSQGVPTVLKITGTKVTPFEHTEYYGRPQDVAPAVHAHQTV